MSATRVELPPLIEGGDPWREHDVKLFQKAESAGFAGGVVASLPALQQVPGDGEVGAGPPELVDMPAEGGSGLLLVLLLHVVHVAIVPLSEGAPRQARVGLGGDVGVVRGGDGGLIHHPLCLALARHWAGWLVLAVAALLNSRSWSVLCNHF